MIRNGWEYALFTFEPKNRTPPVTPFTTAPRLIVLFKKYDGSYEIGREFFEWISNQYFPYKTYIDLSQDIPKDSFSQMDVTAEKLQFRRTSLF